MIATHKITWPQIHSTVANPIKETFGVIGFPTTFLIDSKGVVIAKNIRGKALEEKITTMLGADL